MADENHTTPHDPRPTPPAPARQRSPWMRHRTWAREQDLLTERGWQEGYVVCKPSRWMTRFFFDALLPLNTALQRLEANSFTLLGTSQAFPAHARALAQQLADLRASVRRLARLAERLARGRFPAAEEQEPDEPAASDERGEPPTPAEDLDALQGPTLAETRAARDGR
jgi:hypothetical protein